MRLRIVGITALASFALGSTVYAVSPLSELSTGATASEPAEKVVTFSSVGPYVPDSTIPSDSTPTDSTTPSDSTPTDSTPTDSTTTTTSFPIPDPNPDGPIFPISTKPLCQLVNGFGGYSKARGGSGHAGIDIGATEGQAVFAVESGVLYRQWLDTGTAGKGWGLLTANGDKYRYFHLADFAPGLSEGSRVEQGDVIGFVGDTGNASPGGYHLHFEYRPGPSNDPVNPYPFLDIPSDCKDYVRK